jgi:hypothetical protein
MNEADARALALHLDYAYVRAGDLGWAGYARTLEDAQQACQGVAVGSLHWSAKQRSWIARDPERGALYLIDHLSG